VDTEPISCGTSPQLFEVEERLRESIGIVRRSREKVRASHPGLEYSPLL